MHLNIDVIHNYLNKDSTIRISMGIDCPCSPLPTDVTGECYKHPSPGGFGEEGKWEC